MFWMSKSDERLARKLHAAMAKADIDAISRLISKGADPALNIKSVKRGYEGNALHCHASTHHTSYPDEDRDAVAYIISRGVDVSSPNSTGETPLHLALALHDKNTYIDDCIAYLLDSKANVRATTQNGQTPLHYLAAALEVDEKWQRRSLKRLLSLGANINAQDDNGTTPLMICARKGVQSACELWIDAGADVHMTDQAGKTASAYAAEARHYALSVCLRDKEAMTKRKVVTPPLAVAAPVIAPPIVASPVLPSVEEKLGWSKQTDSKVSCVTIEKSLGYKITEIFNFQARTYVCISQNLKTAAEALVHKTFDDFADKGALMTALEQLRLQGGAADEAVLYSRSLQKSAPKLRNGQ